MATEEEIKIAEKVKFWEEQDEINVILAERIAYLNEELEKMKLENLRNKNETRKTASTSNTTLLYLTLFTSLVAITFSIISLLR